MKILRFLRIFLLVNLMVYAGGAMAVIAKQPLYGIQFFELTDTSPENLCKRTREAYPGADSYSLEGMICVIRRYGDNHRLAINKINDVCPENSSESGASCSCNASFFEEGGQCVAEMSSEKACGVALYNSGSATRSPVTLDGNIADGVYCQPQGDDVKPGLACAMTFEKDIGWKTDDGQWHSRGVLQPRMIGGNFQPCVPGIDGDNNPPDPAKPPELPKKQDNACPNGYPGDIGGETKCIPSFGYNGVDFAPKTKSSETATTKTDTTTKTECSSGKCKTTETVKVTDKATGQTTTTENVTTEVDRDWCNKSENKDKCAANGKPPYAGQGTDSSGTEAQNGDGDGEEKGGRCGAKGQPPCKIDETGTPTGEGKFDPALDKQAQDHQHRMDTLGGIKSTADKDTSMGFTGFAWLTHKACSPWNLGDLKILTETFKIELNICVIEPYVIPVMNFLWILATIFMTFSRVASVMGAKVD
ncbi:hypothetical protein [Comamonas suwonensis]|uniref:hypothetical protein n=1 Tax=Comamonas suwonensis TaxID=2606214 RepID=UPI00145C918D|nr:hypothetical protein [Comamonas suwonensis]MBI1623941.1 hypothetical protein [Comamonas suwonensis]